MYRKIISTKKYVTKSSIKSYVWYNRMSLLSKYKNCIGGKNGYTPKAGKSLVSYAKKNNLVLTIISLGDPLIYENHKNLYNKYFSIYKNYKIIEKGEFFVNGDNYYISQSFMFPLTDDEKKDITTLVKINKNSFNNEIGKIEIMLSNKKIGSTKIYKNKNKKRK